MRLINVETHKLHQFFGGSDAIPHYAILSHRWEKEEVTYHDFENGQATEMYGWSKVIGCLRQAMMDGLQYAWIDSCCIDKSSSAEVSEAINSMFRWYQDAEICYVYLSDVEVDANGSYKTSEFQASKWFRRGWTLQELLAPHDLRFFDRKWKEIGTKEGLEDVIKATTGIQHLFNFEEASIAQKMFWASRRDTTRVEDLAYCLMGLFGVNMPPLYGEGQIAFLRLQLEIMKNNNDESLFAWTDDSIARSGLLAASPVAFKNSGNVRSLNPQWLYRPPYAMTNKGLQIEFNFAELRLNVAELRPKVIAPLNCALEGDNTQAVALLLVNDGLSEVGFIRTACGTLHFYDKDNTRDLQPRAALYIREPLVASGTTSRCYFRISTPQLLRSRTKVSQLRVSNPDLGHWSKGSEAGHTLRLRNSNALMVFERGDDRFILRVSSDDGAASLHLLVRESANPVTSTEVLHLSKEPPTIPHWSSLSGLKCYFGVQSDEIRKRLPSGNAVHVLFYKIEGRSQFEVEVSLAPSYAPINAKAFPLPMSKMKTPQTDANMTESGMLEKEATIFTRFQTDLNSTVETATITEAMEPSKMLVDRSFRTNFFESRSPSDIKSVASYPPVSLSHGPVPEAIKTKSTTKGVSFHSESAAPTISPRPPVPLVPSLETTAAVPRSTPVQRPRSPRQNPYAHSTPGIDFGSARNFAGRPPPLPRQPPVGSRRASQQVHDSYESPLREEYLRDQRDQRDQRLRNGILDTYRER